MSELSSSSSTAPALSAYSFPNTTTSNLATFSVPSSSTTTTTTTTTAMLHSNPPSAPPSPARYPVVATTVPTVMGTHVHGGSGGDVGDGMDTAPVMPVGAPHDSLYEQHFVAASVAPFPPPHPMASYPSPYSSTSATSNVPMIPLSSSSTSPAASMSTSIAKSLVPGIGSSNASTPLAPAAGPSSTFPAPTTTTNSTTTTTALTTTTTITPVPSTSSTSTSSAHARSASATATPSSFASSRAHLSPFASQGDAGGGGAAAAVAAVDNSPLGSWKAWGLQQLKIVRRAVSERLGGATPTVDRELEAEVQKLQDTQATYKHLLGLARALASHLQSVINTQRQLTGLFNDMSVRNPDLQKELTLNAETQRTLYKSGLSLLGAINYFVENVHTLTNKTMADTLATWDAYRTARLAYDAERAELEAAKAGAGPGASSDHPSIVSAETSFGTSRRKYEAVKEGLRAKLKYLDENKTKVMKKQLMLFHNATCAFFAGNQAELDRVLAELHLTPIRAEAIPEPTWLEQLRESAVSSLATV